ncbi:MAG TPA: hypothetical protein VJ777_32450 [Mycobacterium sp.]|nr:hypothetical protein [Mycobacterium sp.]
MTPFTYHFLGQFLRHSQALVASVDKWVKSPGFSASEAQEACVYLDRVIDAYKRSLPHVDKPEEAVSKAS